MPSGDIQPVGESVGVMRNDGGEVAREPRDGAYWMVMSSSHAVPLNEAEVVNWHWTPM